VAIVLFHKDMQPLPLSLYDKAGNVNYTVSAEDVHNGLIRELLTNHKKLLKQPEI